MKTKEITKDTKPKQNLKSFVHDQSQVQLIDNYIKLIPRYAFGLQAIIWAASPDKQVQKRIKTELTEVLGISKRQVERYISLKKSEQSRPLPKLKLEAILAYFPSIETRHILIHQKSNSNGKNQRIKPRVPEGTKED